MRDLEERSTPPVESEKIQQEERQEDAPNDSSRRSFMGKMGMGTAAAVALAATPLEPLIEGKHGQAAASTVPYDPNSRAYASFQYRDGVADAENIDVGELPDNGDLARYPDYSGSWSKVMPHPYIGIVSPAAYQTFLYAARTGQFQDWQNVIVGNPGGTNFTATFNGPMGSYAFDLEGRDSHATNFIPPSPTDRSAQTADEEVEHYWGALCRDVHFTDYATNPVVAQAVAEMNSLTYVQSHGSEYPYPLTPKKLFRGYFPSNPIPNQGPLMGPFVSQFMLQPTFFGAQPLNQMFQTFLAIGQGGSDYLTSPAEYLRVQSGANPSYTLHFDPTYRLIRDGRDLAAWTHVDELHQAYFTALLVLLGINAPLNPGNPYIGSLTQHGFPTLGGPDFLATIPELATRALKGVWFHKWIVNLRFRPEEYGGLVQARLTNQRPMPDAALELHPDILNSQAIQKVYSKYGSYLLPVAFPEGAPGHPCYPTGHGTVAGACIAALKFFFDGSQKLVDLGLNIVQPSEDGLSLVPYTGSDAGQLTVNGELDKLGWNITEGHGLVGASIHFRSSSLYSLLLGEAIGLSVLQDRANSYAEPFSISLTKFDGTTVTISNEH